jgi:hypothetical protein
MDNKFKSEGDIRDRLGYPILGTTPYFKFKNLNKNANQIYEKIPYQMIEAFNTIRLNFKYISVDRIIKK